eukprot:363960-Chlamydomonas_euryale.AAC.3
MKAHFQTRAGNEEHYLNIAWVIGGSVPADRMSRCIIRRRLIRMLWICTTLLTAKCGSGALVPGQPRHKCGAEWCLGAWPTTPQVGMVAVAVALALAVAVAMYVQQVVLRASVVVVALIQLVEAALTEEGPCCMQRLNIFGVALPQHETDLRCCMQRLNIVATTSPQHEADSRCFMQRLICSGATWPEYETAHRCCMPQLFKLAARPPLGATGAGDSTSTHPHNHTCTRECAWVVRAPLPPHPHTPFRVRHVVAHVQVGGTRLDRGLENVVVFATLEGPRCVDNQGCVWAQGREGVRAGSLWLERRGVLAKECGGDRLDRVGESQHGELYSGAHAGLLFGLLAPLKRER